MENSDKALIKHISRIRALRVRAAKAQLAHAARMAALTGSKFSDDEFLYWKDILKVAEKHARKKIRL